MKNDLMKASKFTAQLGERMSKLYEHHNQLIFFKSLIEDDFNEILGANVELKISEDALFHVVLKEPFFGHDAGTEWDIAETISHCYYELGVMDK